MSKVVHLSDASHRRAKDFCKLHQLRMSDWVAALIDEAINEGRTDTRVRNFVPKRKILEKLQTVLPPAETNTPVYAQPPFWERKG